MFMWDGYRSGLCRGAPANTTIRGTMPVLAPSKAGQYILQTTMVQERVCWFEQLIQIFSKNLPYQWLREHKDNIRRGGNNTAEMGNSLSNIAINLQAKLEALARARPLPSGGCHRKRRLWSGDTPVRAPCHSQIALHTPSYLGTGQ